MEKLTKQETVVLFDSLAKKYGVLDQAKSGGGHDRFRLGKDGNSKSLFLACSRVGWMCVYVDSTEKVLLENNGFTCKSITSGDELYEFRCRINADDFERFFEVVKEYLNR